MRLRVKQTITLHLNPLAIPWVALRVLVRVIMGKKKRNEVFTQIGWGRPDGFLLSLGLPKHLVRSWMVKLLHKSVVDATHEPEVSSFLLRKSAGKLFIDIGANHGYYSFLLHSNFERIIAIEPHPENLDILRVGKQVYGYPHVEVLPFAVDSSDGQVNLYIGCHSGGHSLFHYGRFIKTGKFIKVSAKTLASVLADIAGDVDLVKLDVEGAEWHVLEGAKPVMNRIQSWLIELHDLTKKRHLEEFTSKLGYKYHWVNNNHLYAFRR